MLEFIVLGQIPGTGFVITFTWFVALAAIAVGYSVVRVERTHRTVLQQVRIDDISI